MASGAATDSLQLPRHDWQPDDEGYSSGHVAAETLIRGMLVLHCNWFVYPENLIQCVHAHEHSRTGHIQVVERVGQRGMSPGGA